MVSATILWKCLEILEISEILEMFVTLLSLKHALAAVR